MARKRRMSAAQRKYFGRRSSRRVSSSRVRRSRGRGRSTGGGGLTGLLVGSAVYGAGRGFVSSKLAPVTANIPLGGLADEAVMGTLSYFVAQGKIPLVNKIPYSRDIGRAGLTIEAARAGEYLAARFMPNVTSSTGNGQYL